jgi:hypothetical protein
MLSGSSPSLRCRACPFARSGALSWSLRLLRGACWRNRGGLLRGSVRSMAAVLTADLGAGAAGGGENQPGGGLRGHVLGSRQDGRVRVGGQYDAGVAKLILDCLQIGAGRVGEAGGTMPQVVQPDRRQPAPFRVHAHRSDHTPPRPGVRSWRLGIRTACTPLSSSCRHSSSSAAATTRVTTQRRRSQLSKR